MDKMKFGSYIKESRIKMNYTQQELADLLFVDVSAVSKWERGVSYPDITLIPDICRVLEVSEHELIESCSDEESRKMRRDAKKYNKMKKSTFWILNICYLIAIITCFIVNISVNHTLSWFFIVLTSIMCAYSFCPTITWMFKKFKNVSFIVSTFISMFLVFLSCSVYTNNYWFMIATLGVLLGYFIVFYPLLFKKQKSHLSEEKYYKLSKWFLLSYFTIILIIISLLLVCIYCYIPFNLGVGLLIVEVCLMIPIGFGILNLFEVSKSLNKPILLSLAGILVLLIIGGICRSLYLKSTEVNKIYNIEESYSNISIVGKSLDVNIYLSNNNENKVVYVENKKLTIEVKVIDDVLTINQNDNRKFYDMLFNFSDFKVDLYLKEELIDSLKIKGGVGDIKIYECLTFGDVEIDNSTGDIEFNSNVYNNIKLNNSTGDIEIKNSNIDGEITISTSTGDIDLNNVRCNKLEVKINTGDTELDNVLVASDFILNGSTGDVDFNNFDASNIYVNVETGDIKGNILSEKIFVVRSNTGSVKVPETLNGGICKISTSTGNIKISYK